MGIKITRASDPIRVERLTMVLFSQPGLGKTSLAFTADAPLLLDFDSGAHRAVNRKDAVRVTSWADVSGISAADLEPFNTVIVDTAGRALDVLTPAIIRDNPKHGRGGALTLQGYGELKTRFTAFLKLLTSFGKDVVLIAHMDEQRSGDDVLERLDMQGGSKNELFKQADAMGRLVMREGHRQLLFSPSDTSFGKNPGQLPPLDVPHMTDPAFDGFLARVIQQTKDALNAQTEAQKEAAQEQAWFRDTLPRIEDADGINALRDRAKAAGRAVQVMLHNRAKEIGLTADKASGGYVAPAREAAE